MVDGSPVGQSADVPVIDEDIRFEFAAPVFRSLMITGILVNVSIDGVEAYASFFAPFHSLFQQFSLSDGEEDEFVTFFHEAAQGGSGKGKFFPDGGIAMLDNGAVKIY